MWMNSLLLLQIVAVFLICLQYANCLYPFESRTRTKYSLNGLWEFKVDFANEGFTNLWYLKSFKTQLNDTYQIAVPSSFNDLYTNKTIKNHIGWIWYNREFNVNDAIINRIDDYKIILRISSCHYYCIVWLNGDQLGTHESGHLPFEFDITNIVVDWPVKLNLVIAVNNTLTPFTIPPGQIFQAQNSSLYPDNYVQQILQMDFYNFAGIHRDVVVYIKPVYHIKDLVLVTDYDPGSDQGILRYNIIHNCPGQNKINVYISNKTGGIVASSDKENDTLYISNPMLWWPRNMKNNFKPHGYLYTIEVSMGCSSNRYIQTNSILGATISDSYSLDFGIRKISWSSGNSGASSWLINGQPFYCMGVNKHEDFSIIGRGIDLAILLKDIYLFDWLNVNCVRTSHYPYTEEFLQLTDKLGIAVIDELPAVGLTLAQNFNNITLNLHKQLAQELYDRDKNHPSVIMWSVANEPATNLKESYPYFKEVFGTIKSIDTTRPATFTVSVSLKDDLCANFSDIISVNRYYGWYIGTGILDIISYQLTNDIQNWIDKYNKPLIITEYGADALAGIHCYPELMFCEEFQTSLLTEHHKVFDAFRNKSLLFGELVWNFADFMTDQSLIRVNGNHKGLFTDHRQPKSSAFLIKNRYDSMYK